MRSSYLRYQYMSNSSFLAASIFGACFVLIAGGHAAQPGLVADAIWGLGAVSLFCLLCLMEGDASG